MCPAGHNRTVPLCSQYKKSKTLIFAGFAFSWMSEANGLINLVICDNLNVLQNRFYCMIGTIDDIAGKFL